MTTSSLWLKLKGPSPRIKTRPREQAEVGHAVATAEVVAEEVAEAKRTQAAHLEGAEMPPRNEMFQHRALPLHPSQSLFLKVQAVLEADRIDMANEANEASEANDRDCGDLALRSWVAVPVRNGDLAAT